MNKRHGERRGQPIVDYYAKAGARELADYLQRCHPGHDKANHPQPFFGKITTNLEMNEGAVYRLIKQGISLGLIERKYSKRTWPSQSEYREYLGYGLTEKGEQSLKIIKKLDRIT